MASGASHLFHPASVKSDLQWEILQNVPLNVSTVRGQSQSPGENPSGRFLLQFVVSAFFGFTNFVFFKLLSFKCLQSILNLFVEISTFYSLNSHLKLFVFLKMP